MLKAREKLGKYRIIRRIARGGFANVFEALDTVEGVRVAVKVPHPYLITDETLDDFQREARLTAKLDHPNILPIKNADYIDGLFAIVYPMGKYSLADRLKSRISLRTAVEFVDQILDALAHAHRHGVIHCDVKPDNFIVFPGNRLRLTDFGLAKMPLHTLTNLNLGTVGYIAPEQAMGRPSFRSDVFSAGLVIYEIFTRELPTWPFDWPPPGFDKAKRKIHPEFLALLRRTLEVDERKRFSDAQQMRNAFRRIRAKVLAHSVKRNSRNRRPSSSKRDWKTIRFQEFRKRYGRSLEVRATCGECGGPISERMEFCPWCGKHCHVYGGETRFPTRCRRCGRGMKLDWRFCPWCYGPGVDLATNRRYSDVRYEGRCSNPSCTRKELVPFVHYCPWCRTKVRHPWRLAGSKETCGRCGWGVLREFWDYCAWCGKPLRQ
jgi:serine/threonine-protein kinase